MPSRRSRGIRQRRGSARSHGATWAGGRVNANAAVFYIDWDDLQLNLPDIAAHYIKYDLIDGTFEVDEPEMILYDGNGPDARVVGLSYYIWHEGDAEPTVPMFAKP